MLTANLLVVTSPKGKHPNTHQVRMNKQNMVCPHDEILFKHRLFHVHYRIHKSKYADKVRNEDHLLNAAHVRGLP